MASSDRIDLLDSVRGFALCGLFLVHAVEMFELYWANPQPGPVFDWVFGLFAGKSFALFALCFGVSTHLMAESAGRRGEAFDGRYAWRLVLLAVIGTLHGLWYRGDILQTLAIVGLVLIPLRSVRSVTIVAGLGALFLLQWPHLIRAWAAAEGQAWALIPPAYFSSAGMAEMAHGTLGEVIHANATAGLIGKWSFYLETGRLTQIIGLFAVGMALGRINFFRNPEASHRLQVVALAVSLALFAVLFFGKPGFTAFLPAGDAMAMTRQNLNWVYDSFQALALMAAELLVLVLLWQIGGRKIIGLLAPFGRMTLSFYLLQSLVFVPVFYGFGLGLFDDVTQMQCLMLGLVALVLQIAIAHLWLRSFRMGPMEWLWRAATDLNFSRPLARNKLASTDESAAA